DSAQHALHSIRDQPVQDVVIGCGRKRNFLWKLRTPRSYQAEERSTTLWSAGRCLFFYRDYGCIGEKSLSSRSCIPVLGWDPRCVGNDVPPCDISSAAL